MANGSENSALLGAAGLETMLEGDAANDGAAADSRLDVDDAEAAFEAAIDDVAAPEGLEPWDGLQDAVGGEEGSAEPSEETFVMSFDPETGGIWCGFDFGAPEVLEDGDAGGDAGWEDGDDGAGDDAGGEGVGIWEDGAGDEMPPEDTGEDLPDDLVEGEIPPWEIIVCDRGFDGDATLGDPTPEEEEIFSIQILPVVLVEDLVVP